MKLLAVGLLFLGMGLSEAAFVLSKGNIPRRAFRPTLSRRNRSRTSCLSRVLPCVRPAAVRRWVWSKKGRDRPRH